MHSHSNGSLFVWGGMSIRCHGCFFRRAGASRLRGCGPALRRACLSAIFRPLPGAGPERRQAGGRPAVHRPGPLHLSAPGPRLEGTSAGTAAALPEFVLRLSVPLPVPHPGHGLLAAPRRGRPVCAPGRPPFALLHPPLPGLFPV